MVTSPEIWRHIFDTIDDPIFLHDQEYRLLLANRAFFQAAGMEEAEAIGKPYWEVFPRNGGPLPGCKQALDGECAESVDEVKAGECLFISEDYPVRDGQGKVLYSLHILSDITEHRKAETALRDSVAQLRTVVENIAEGVAVSDLDGQLLHFNRAALEMHGYAELDQYLRHLNEYPDTFELAAMDGTILPVDQWPLARILRGENLRNFEVRIRNIKAGWRKIFSYGGTLVRDADGQPLMAVVTLRDITERKQAELHLARLNRMYRTISRCNEALVRAQDELELAREMCRVLVEKGEFRAAWVGYAEQDAGKSVHPVASAGFKEGYLEGLELTWADEGLGRGLTGQAIRTGEVAVSQSIDAVQKSETWRGLALQLGILSAAVLPLKVNGKVMGVLAVSGAEPDVFTEDIIELLAELAGDLAFGIGNLRSRAERMGILEMLEHSLDHAVTAIAATVEMRDPYTAGHQRRVAKLAAAIATEMGLPGSQVEGLHMAGVVHDIGKIHVPAEILASPAKLSDAEFAIIKTHPQAGWEILKSIDFPWPVAEMAYQHHEKLDGSGYPRGLKGEEILLEARILMVADVVEAMTSHRPYRPGFGVFPALQEVSRNKGKLYDVAVVEACMRVFMEKNYEW